MQIALTVRRALHLFKFHLKQTLGLIKFNLLIFLDQEKRQHITKNMVFRVPFLSFYSFQETHSHLSSVLGIDSTIQIAPITDLTFWTLEWPVHCSENTSNFLVWCICLYFSVRSFCTATLPFLFLHFMLAFTHKWTHRRDLLAFCLNSDFFIGSNFLFAALFNSRSPCYSFVLLCFKSIHSWDLYCPFDLLADVPISVESGLLCAG